MRGSCKRSVYSVSPRLNARSSKCTIRALSLGRKPKNPAVPLRRVLLWNKRIGEAFRKLLRGCARIDVEQEMARWNTPFEVEELEQPALPLTKQKSR